MMQAGRIQGLDALRGLAIFLVIVRHGFPDVASSAGIVGVVIFFALSGYLITGILSRDIERLGRVNYRHFYRNRALRLLPALVVVVVTYAIGATFFGLFGGSSEVLRTVVVALTYTADIPGVNNISLAMSHLWTLAVEEQFYLVWPFLLTLALRRARVGSLFLTLCIGALVLCATTIVLVAPDIARVYRLPTSWLIALLVGAAARIWRARVAKILDGLPSVLVVGMPLVFVLSVSLLPNVNDRAELYLIGAPAIAIATVALIHGAERWESVPSWAGPFNYLGRVSYGAYLWNFPIAVGLGVSGLGGWDGLLSVALTIAAATVSWYALEKPCQRLKVRLDQRQRDQANLNGSSVSP
jgi:peptidoglycan/LPS O-acetylase OafA/YrhL